MQNFKWLSRSSISHKPRFLLFLLCERNACFTHVLCGFANGCVLQIFRELVSRSVHDVANDIGSFQKLLEIPPESATLEELEGMEQLREFLVARVSALFPAVIEKP